MVSDEALKKLQEQIAAWPKRAAAATTSRVKTG